MTNHQKVKVAAAHVAPVFLDAARSVDKACSLIVEAAGAGAGLIAFPESFIPAFPVWAALQAPIHGHDLFRALAANALRIDRSRAMPAVFEENPDQPDAAAGGRLLQTDAAPVFDPDGRRL